MPRPTPTPRPELTDLVRNQAPEFSHGRPSTGPLAVVVSVDVHHQLLGLLVAVAAGILRQRQLHRVRVKLGRQRGTRQDGVSGKCGAVRKGYMRTWNLQREMSMGPAKVAGKREPLCLCLRLCLRFRLLSLTLFLANGGARAVYCCCRRVAPACRHLRACLSLSLSIRTAANHAVCRCRRVTACRPSARHQTQAARCTGPVHR